MSEAKFRTHSLLVFQRRWMIPSQFTGHDKLSSITNESQYGFRYRNLLAILCFVKDEVNTRTTRTLSNTPRTEKIGQSFDKRIDEYREKLGRQIRQAQPNSAHLEDFLYRVACFNAFGYTDYVKLLVADDYDLFFRLTSDRELPINQISLGFLPELESFGVYGKKICGPNRAEWEDHKLDNWLQESVSKQFFPNLASVDRDELIRRSPFIDIEDILRRPSESASHRENPVHRETPLVAFSRLRLNGIATLAPGLLRRRAIFRALARQVVRVQARLLESINSRGWLGRARHTRRLLQKLEIDRESILNLSVAFLEMQGPEEIAVVIGCRNYSIAASLSVAFQDLTFGDLYDNEIGGQHLKEFEQQTDTHRVVRDLLRDTTQDSLLTGNHLISQVYSVMTVTESIDQEALLDEPSRTIPISGKVEVYSRSNVSGGHLAGIQDTLIDFLSTPSSNIPITKLNWRDVLRYLVGRYDYDYSYAWGVDQKLSLLATRQFLGRSFELQVLFGITCPKQFENHSMDSDAFAEETGLLDISSHLVVPVPRIDAQGWTFPKTQFENHHSINTALVRLVDRVFGPPSSPNDNSPPHFRNAPPLCYRTLEQALHDSRLPIRVQRSVLQLFKNFHQALQDALLFDHVLDLYDAMLALHSKLTIDLPAMAKSLLDTLRSGQGNDFKLDPREFASRQIALFDQRLIEGIVDYVDAMQNALDHRIYQESSLEFAEWSVDLRGGLVQLALGATLPMKVGVGLLRWAIEHDFGNSRSEGQTHFPTDRKFGVVARLSLNQRSEVRQMFRYPSDRSTLAILTFSVAHIFSPGEFTQYLHETGHLLLREWDRFEGLLETDLDRDQENVRHQNLENHCYNHEATFDLLDLDLPSLYEQHLSGLDARKKEFREELFAILLTQLFVFQSDWEVGQRHRMLLFETSNESGGSNLDDAYARFTEAAFDAFLAVSGILELREQRSAVYLLHPGNWVDQHPWIDYSQPYQLRSEFAWSKNIADRFKKFIESVGNVYHGGRRYYNPDGDTGWLNKVLDWSTSDWKLSDHQQNIRKILKQKCLYARRILPDVWRRAVQIRRAFFNDCWGKSGHDTDWLESFRETIEECLQTGQGSTCELFHRLALTDCNAAKYLGHIDEFAIFLEVIRSSVEWSMKHWNSSAELHMTPQEIDRRSPYFLDWGLHEAFSERPFDTASVNTDPQIDRVHTRPCWLSPESRRMQLRRDIAALRLLWDLAARQRARRFKRLSSQTHKSPTIQTLLDPIPISQ